MAALILTTACQPQTIADSAGAPTDSITATPVPTGTPTPETTPTGTPISTITPTAIPTPYIVGPEIYPEAVNPLTGLPVSDPALLQRRPLLIKISNAPPVVRPQSGLSYADMIFEEYVEGGWTRFAALFYSQGVDHVGSVRSVRLVDFQLAQAYDAILIFSGGSRGVIDLLREEPLYPYNTISPQFGYGQPYFVRFPREGLATEHTLFSDTALFWQWTAERNVRQIPRFLEGGGMAFQDQPPAGGSPASFIRLTYARTTAEWQYDPTGGKYLRWTDGVPHTDALTGEQLAFSNVIILSAYHEEWDILPEKYNGEEKSLYIELQGEGPVTILRDGQAYEGRWQHTDRGSVIVYVDLDGNPLYLKPGTTFIHFIRVGFEELEIIP